MDRGEDSGEAAAGATRPGPQSRCRTPAQLGRPPGERIPAPPPPAPRGPELQDNAVFTHRPPKLPFCLSALQKYPGFTPMLLPSGVQRWTRDPGFIFSKKQNHPLAKGDKVKSFKRQVSFHFPRTFPRFPYFFPSFPILAQAECPPSPQELPPRSKAGTSKLRLKGEGTQRYKREHGAVSVKEESACARTVHLCLEAEPSTPGHTASRALAAAHCQSQHALPARPPHSAAFEPGAQEGDLPGPRLRTPCWHLPRSGKHGHVGTAKVSGEKCMDTLLIFILTKKHAFNEF